MKDTLSNTEKKTAYILTLPAVVLVFAIILFPIIANVWISCKEGELKDIRIPEPRAKKIVKSVLEDPSKIKILYKLRNSSLLQEIRDVSFKDKFPKNFEIGKLDTRCMGFGKNQQSVLLHSFVAAYSGSDPNRIELNPIKNTPSPNWDLKFTGLTEIKSIAKIFKRLSLNHAYRASYTLTNFQSNFDYDPTMPNQTDKSGNFIPQRLYSNINLVEQFNPLVKLDIEFINSFKILAELRKERAISLSLDNNLITETSGDEYIMGLGYRVKDVRFKTSIGGRKVVLKGDLNIKADVSYRDNITVLRNLEYDNNQVTAGQRLMAIKVTADYALTKNLTALFFYDHNFSEFAISTAFPQTSIRSGFTIRYNFGN